MGTSDSVLQITATCAICGMPHANHPHEYRNRGDAQDFQGATMPRSAQFANYDVEPAANLYITVEDRLRVLLFNSVAGAEVDITLRLQLPSGEVIPMQRAMLPANNRAVQTFEFDLAEGFLLDIAAVTPTASVRSGACFVVAQIIRGTGANAVPSRTLISNYVTSSNLIGWPEGPAQNPVQGNGLARSVQVANPAAGADWVTSVPAGARWLVQSVRAVLTASAAVANRIVHLVITDGGGNTLFNVAASGNQVAGQAIGWSACGGVQAALNDGAGLLPLPDVASYLQGWTIGTATTAKDAGDQWSAISLNVLEWIEP